MTTPIVFARIGWMEWYRGPQEGDERPRGGGKWNEENVGSEVFNFREIGGRLYGYFETMGSKTNLQRIDRNARSDKVAGVTVVFIATRPPTLGGGQVVVGWYNNATVFASRSDRPKPGQGYFFVCEARAADSCLLPLSRRAHRIPAHVKGGFGQNNVRYPITEAGKSDLQPWMRSALAFTEEYQGPNLLAGAAASVEDEVAALYEQAEIKGSGQGFGGSPAERKAVEDWAMRKAIAHFRSLGYDTDPEVHRTKPYDIACSKAGADPLFVEVKGTVGTGASVILTRNEVKHMRSHARQCALYVVCGIRLKRRGKVLVASGGVCRVYQPVRVDEKYLSAICYDLALPEE